VGRRRTALARGERLNGERIDPPVQSVCLGSAAVFDTVLLLALLEKRNWPFVRLPIVLLLAGGWMWHAGSFALLLLGDLPGEWVWYLQGICMLSMTTGLLLMPCSILHSAWRVAENRVNAQPHSLPRHALVYLPMLAAIPLALVFFTPGRGGFAASVAGLEQPFVVFAGLANVVAAVVFFQVGRRLPLPQASSFFTAMAIVLLSMTALKWGVYLPGNILPGPVEGWRLAVALSPLAPALLFAYFIIRFQFFQIVLERSLVYGGILGAILLLHQLAFQDVSAALPEGYRLHVVFLEALVLAGLVLFYQPLRERTAEALRYLLGSRVEPIRDRLRQIAAELTAQTGKPMDELLAWFARVLTEAVQAEYLVGRLSHKQAHSDIRIGEAPQWSAERMLWLDRAMRSANMSICVRRQTANLEIARCLQEASASLAMIRIHKNVTGLLVIGSIQGKRDLSGEEINGVLLLIEQLAITLDNSVLQAERLAAERRAMQNEKLSALGLLASSIAHEVKNPLSAIKTIATVMAEELGPNHPLATDVCLILGEVDRLAQTTAQWLDLARPSGQGRTPASVPDALAGMLQLLRPLAKEQAIAIETDFPSDLPPIQADEHTLREIFFNLVSNSVEAAGPGGKVCIRCHRDNGCVVTEVSDSGTGMPEEVRAHLFEPFLTTKQAGTGLGLYLVGKRVGELGGVIRCDRSTEQGTCFTVRLPYTPHV